MPLNKYKKRVSSNRDSLNKKDEELTDENIKGLKNSREIDAKVEQNLIKNCKTRLKLSLGSATNTIRKDSQQEKASLLQKLPSDEAVDGSSPERVGQQLVDESNNKMVPECQEVKNNKPITNAFTFMMNSRFNVIGQNLSGKELKSPKEICSNYTKNEIKAQNLKLQKWADAKGAKKRKIDYEERGIIIEKKLHKRRKHLKNMLSLTERCNNVTEENSDDEIVVRKKTVRVIESDSESVDICANEVVEENFLSDPKINFEKEETVFENTGSPNKEPKDGHTFEGALKFNETNGHSLKQTNFVTTTKQNSDSAANLEKEILTANTIKKWKMRIKVHLENANGISASDKELNSVQESKTPICESDSDSNEPLAFKKYCKKPKKATYSNVKIAPLFQKANSKLTAEAQKARRDFLHSSVPVSLRKITNTAKTEDSKYLYFPSVSHVMVKPISDNVESGSLNFWNLPPVNLEVSRLYTSFPNVPLLLSQGSVTSRSLNNFKMAQITTYNVSNIKKQLANIKARHPDYPVYKSYKYLYQKRKDCRDVINESEETRNQNFIKSKKIIIEDSSNCNKLWTDLYMPSTSEEIFGNQSAITKIKEWLQKWLDYDSLESDSKRNRRCSSSSSDFEGSNDSYKNKTTVDNTLILNGPHGSGKTMAVYAICNEFGINVIEVNASSKRTGKHLLGKLQEATQSHQVQQKEPFSISKQNYSKSNSQNSDSSSSNSKICLLLIEDVDVVFDQDDNFITALWELIATSKRPLILTSSDKDCLHLKRFINDYPIVNFSKLSSKNVLSFLQVLCLVEGFAIELQKLINLVSKNESDLRRSILELQFWFQSKFNVQDGHVPEILENLEDDVDKTLLSTEDTRSLSDVNAAKVHTFAKDPVTLRRVRWDIPPRICIQKNIKDNDNLENETLGCSQTNKVHLSHLKNISDTFDVLAFAEVCYKKLNLECNFEQLHKMKLKITKDSLSLNESLDNFSTDQDICLELSNYLLDEHLKLVIKTDVDVTETNNLISEFAMWQKKQTKNDQLFVDIVSSECYLNRKAVYLEYLATFRLIARSESSRALKNGKRNNRFYNYLRSVGMNCDEQCLKTACNVFK